MSKTLTLLMCLLAKMAIAQHSFVLKGSTNYCQNGYAIFGESYENKALYSYSIKHDSAKIENGNFTFSGKIAYPQMFFIKLISKGKEYYTEDFFIDTAIQYLTINTSERSKNYLGFSQNGVITKNSVTNHEFLERYLPLFTVLNKKVESIFNEYDNSSENDASKSKFIKQRDSCRLVRDSILLSYAFSHENSAIVPWMLFEHIKRYGYKEHYQNIFDNIKWNGVDLKIAIGNFLQRKRDIDIGKVLPYKSELVDEFVATNTFANYVLVDFWFSTCHPCLGQFEKLRSIYSTYSSAGFKVVAVSTDELKNKAQYESLLLKKNYPWYQKLDGGAVIANKLYIDKFPSNFLLDKDGRIISIDIDPVQLKSFLEKHLTVNH